MKYFNLCGLTASRIAQGCMRISDMSASQAEALIKTDIEAGINFFDHADIYGGGECEKIFGEVLKATPSLRDKIIIQTKCGIRRGSYDFSYEHIIESAENSLTRLSTDCLDFLLLHRPDALCEPEVVAEAFSRLHSSGKVRFFGVSNHNPMQIMLLNKYLGENKIVVNQLQFSLTNTGMLDSGLNVNMKNDGCINRDGSVIDFCRLNDITIQPWSPLQYGFFDGTFIGSDKYPELNSELDRIANEKNITPTELAISWILRHPAGMQPVIGTVNLQRIRDICCAANTPISHDEWYSLYLSAGNELP